MSTTQTPAELPNEVSTYLADYFKQYNFGMNIMPKTSSKLMRAIGWFFGLTKISPEFMTRYYTTIGDTVYVPDELIKTTSPENLLRVIVHEGVHVYDSHKLSNPLFKFLYLFPQSMASLALISLLAPLSLKFLWCLLFLLCLAPLPAPFRYLFELRAYRTSIIFARKTDNLTDEQMIPIYEWIEKQLCSNLYYWTWPFPKAVRKHLQDESWMNTGIYKPIMRWLIVRNVVAALKDNQNK